MLLFRRTKHLSGWSPPQKHHPQRSKKHSTSSRISSPSSKTRSQNTTPATANGYKDTPTSSPFAWTAFDPQSGAHSKKDWITTRKTPFSATASHRTVSRPPSIKSIAGDFPWQARGVYFDAVLSPPSDADAQTRLYIGQSTNLRLRISQHQKFRYRRDNPSLHYHALQKSEDNAYGTLIVLPSAAMGNHALPGMDKEGLLLDVMEMWMCLLFRCLQGETLANWLPGSVEREGRFGALNVWAPVERWEGGKGEMVDMRESGDRLVREWGELKREEWKERVMKELNLEERKEEKVDGPSAVESAPPWLCAVGGAIGGAAVMWLVLGRVRGR